MLLVTLFMNIYGLITKQYGFIAMAIAYAAIYIKSYLHWKRDERLEVLDER